MSKKENGKNCIDFSKDVAMLLKRVEISKDCTIYLPVDVIMGRYDGEDEIFETISGECYSNISDNIISADKKEFCFIDAFTDIELMDTFGGVDKCSYNDAIRNYARRYEKKIYINFAGEYVNGISKDHLFYEFRLDELASEKHDVKEMGDLLAYIKEVNKKVRELKDSLNSSLGKKRVLDSISANTEAFVTLYNNLVEPEEQYVKKGAKKILMQEDALNVTKTYPTKNPGSICKYIKSTIKGQDEKVEELVYGILRLERIKNNYPDKNAGVLLTGRTGTGKTKIVSILGQCLNRPVFVIDATQLSVPGYVGMSIEDFLQQLYNEVTDMKKIEKAIIVFDEIDKKGSSKNEDVSGKGVLNTLLKFLDGTTYKIKEGKTINTKNMIVIFSGAFSNVYDYGKTSKNIGFVNDEPTYTEIDTTEFMKKAQFPDESVGRFPVHVHLNDLTKDDLINILQNSKESDIEVQKRIFQEMGFRLEVSDDYYEKAAELAIKEKTGARSLQKIVQASTFNAFMWASNSLYDNPNNIDTILISAKTIESPENFELKKRTREKTHRL